MDVQSKLFGGAMKQSFWAKNWHFLYFALAAFVVAAICVSLLLSHKNLYQYKQAIEYTNNKIKILDLISEVSQSAQQVNAPGNDVFDSKNAAKEKENHTRAMVDYDKKITALQSLIKANASITKSNDSSTTLETKILDDISLSMADMNEVASRIFVFFEKNETKKAATFMAEMDRRYAKLNHAIENFRKLQREQISQTLESHHKYLSATKELEMYFSILILLAVFGIALFGKHLSRFVKANLINAQKNQEILDAVSNLAIVAFTDNKGKITEVNDNFCKISGYTREELIGKDHRILNSGRHPKSFFSEMWKNIQAGKSWSADIENKKKTGEHYFVRSVISPIRDINGSIEQFIAIRFDITKQKQIENDLKEAETKLIIETAKQQDEKLSELLKFMSATPSCLKIITDKGLLVNMNPQGLNLIEADNLECVLNANVYAIVEETHREAFIKFNEKICSGEKGTLIFEIIGLKGTRHWMETFAAPYTLPNGEMGHVAITNEITNKVNSQKELDLQRNKLLVKSKFESLGEMSAGIAHEINNPLAIISGSVGLLSKFANNPEKFTAKIETIQKSCDRIARIVKSLRKFSRSGDKSCFQTTKMSKIVTEALVLTDAKSKRHSIPVTFDCSTDTNVDCDEVEIEQVLVNLINNAIDAVKSKPEKWVKITLFEKAESLVLRVMDSGPGIKEDVRNKLFEPFFTTKKVGEGTGLGLSISKGILDEHKATITVIADSPNTCFEIRFPKAEAVKNAA